MLLCNYVLTPTLKSTLALPSASVAAAVSPTLLSSAFVIIIAVVLVIHLMPLLRFPLPASGRRGWRVILALAAVNPKEVNKATIHLQLTRDMILCTLNCDKHDAVALPVPLTPHLHMICRWSGIVEFIDGDGGSCALPFQVPPLWLSPVQSILGVDLLPLHLLHHFVPGNDAGAALVVVLPHNFFKDHFIKQFCMDCADEQDRVAIFGHSNFVLTVFHCSVHMEHFVSIVMFDVCIVGDSKRVFCLDGEGPHIRQLGGRVD
jgi:hypothetical protein